MSRLTRLVFALTFLLALLPASAAAQPALPPNCIQVPSPPPAIWLVCMPPADTWNGDLVVFAHGYVAPNRPLEAGFAQLVLPDGTSIPGLVNSQGYAFAATSYPKNGLAVLEGVTDVMALVSAIKAQMAQAQTPVKRVYLIGASEGGLVTTLAVERNPSVFSGGLALCGPVGNFRSQINYFGDFRVVFDYLFPGVLPGSPVVIPPELIAGWPAAEGGIALAMATYPVATRQLLKVTRAATGPDFSSTAVATALQVLWYNVFSTNEATKVLGGQPFDNHNRWYFGSSNDFRLNLRVQRFTAEPAALASIANYQTSGRLRVPLVTMHTTGDPVVPYWHEPLYTAKTIARGSALKHVNIPVAGYGHCNFTAPQTLGAFGLLVKMVTLKPLASPQAALPNAADQAEFLRFTKEISALK